MSSPPISPTPPTPLPPPPRALLVTPAWLAAALTSSPTPPAVIDTRGAVRRVATTPHPDGDGRVDVAVAYTAARAAYAAAAIPSAAFLDWTVDVGARGGRGLPRADAEALLASVGLTRGGGGGRRGAGGMTGGGDASAGGRGGVGDGDGGEVRAVVYDDGAMLFATRLWWAAARLGIHGVAVLDGGWAAWTAADLPTEAGRVGTVTVAASSTAASPHSPPPATPTTATDDADAAVAAAATALPLLTAEDVAAGLVDAITPSPPTARSRSAARRILIDARSAAQYAGRERRGDRAGAIPGALSLPYRALLGTGGVGLASPPQLRAAFDAAGVAPLPSEERGGGGDGATVEEWGGQGPPPPLPALGVYCNGGVASTVVIFCWVLLGGTGAANYGGSWNEWGARRDLPTVRGWE